MRPTNVCYICIPIMNRPHPVIETHLRDSTIVKNIFSTLISQCKTAPYYQCSKCEEVRSVNPGNKEYLIGLYIFVFTFHIVHNMNCSQI